MDQLRAGHYLQLLLRLVYPVNFQVRLHRDCHPASSQACINAAFKGVCLVIVNKRMIVIVNERMMMESLWSCLPAEQDIHFKAEPCMACF